MWSLHNCRVALSGPCETFGQMSHSRQILIIVKSSDSNFMFLQIEVGSVRASIRVIQKLRPSSIFVAFVSRLDSEF